MFSGEESCREPSPKNIYNKSSRPLSAGSLESREKLSSYPRYQTAPTAETGQVKDPKNEVCAVFMIYSSVSPLHKLSIENYAIRGKRILVLDSFNPSVMICEVAGRKGTSSAATSWTAKRRFEIAC